MTSPQSQSETRALLTLGHLELLVTLIVMFVVQGFLNGESAIQRAIFNVLFLALVLSAIRTLSKSKRRMTLAVAIGVIAFIGSWVTESVTNSQLILFVYACYFAVFILLIMALTESVFFNDADHVDRILGATSIFFVLGLLWALAYSTLEILQPGSFQLPVYDDRGIQLGLIGELLYFSIVTLTTLGYGDIIPISNQAQMLAALEAMVGQLYIATVIAHLVGLRISESRLKQHDIQDAERTLETNCESKRQEAPEE